ncbi:Transcription factor bHLH36 [Linum perenne]
MFPLHQGNELCFQISQEDLILPTTTNTTNPLHGTTAAGRRRRRNPATSIGKLNNKNSGGSTSTTTTVVDSNGDSKKVMHRDIERQRRQEMSALYASLRSLLPLEFVKGKRSMSDHMNEAVNYIKELEKRVKELERKRNEVNVLTNGNGENNGRLNVLPDGTTTVEVRRWLDGGVEVVLASPAGSGWRLSEVMRVMVEEGFHVVCCNSTRVNKTWFHTLHAEVEDPTNLNLLALEQKLIPLVLVSSSVDHGND